MTDEERQIQSNLDYQTLIMLQQQKAEEENYEENYEEYYDKPVKWVDQRVKTEFGTMSYTNGAVWWWGNVIIVLTYVALWFYDPPYRTLLFVMGTLSIIFFNIFCKCYAWIKDND
jgi:hypothetical protein